MTKQTFQPLTDDQIKMVEDWVAQQSEAPHTTTPPATTCVEHAYDSTFRLSFQIKVF